MLTFIEDITPPAPEKKYQVTLEMSSHEKEVLQNLLLNALKFKGNLNGDQIGPIHRQLLQQTLNILLSIK
jgi:hypothetical protein